MGVLRRLTAYPFLRGDRLRRLFLVTAVAALTACNALKLGYQQGDRLAYWWIDNYVDVSASQEPLTRDAIARFFAWHRKDQLPEIAGLLRQANYDKAELALQEFVKLHPKEALASNARYWLGETFYVRAAYVQAAEVFLEGFQADPKGPKAPDSLLKLGMSLGGLDKKREACAAFDKLLKDFPDAPAGVKNTVTREKQKNGCS